MSIERKPITLHDLPALQAKLRRKAQSLLRRRRNDGSILPSDLIQSALRRQMRGQVRRDPEREITWENAEHFFASVYNTMRWVLKDHARNRNTDKRQMFSQAVRVESFEDVYKLAQDQPNRTIKLAYALVQLAKTHPDLARIVEHRIFGGLSLKEIAQIENVNEKTVSRRLEKAILKMHDDMDAP